MAVNTTPRVFISYARSDGEAFATQLRQKLEAKNIPLWQDRVGLEGGRDWWLQIQEALDHVQFMVLVITPAALSSPIVKKEWHYARQQGVCVYPVKAHDNVDFQSLPRWMRDRHWYDLDAEWSKFLKDLKRTCEQPRVPFMVEDLPANFVQRPDVFEPLIRCLLDEKREDPIAITAALRGAGGYGKTTLARALCHDERVQEAFDDGILWVTFGEQPGNLVNKVEELLYTLNREKPGYTSLDAAITRLVELLADRDILLVLDDVWNSAHLKPFLQGGKRCARLITTRDERVVPPSVPQAQRIQVDAMQQDEAIQLLINGIQGFSEQALLNQHYSELKQLATRLGEWPLLLMLASSMLQERINLHMQDVAHAIRAVHHALDKRGVKAFDHANAIERSQAVAKTIEISFESLQPEERTRYQELAIFPEDIDIPLQTLQQLWGTTGTLDEFDTEDLCIRLRSLSLLLHYSTATQTIRLHDVMRTYLQHQYTPAELTQLHTHFLDSYPVKRWADLPQREPYLWDHLATHLIAAGRISELKMLVMDGAYLASKAHYRPLALLEQDLALAIEYNPANPVLSRLQHSITNMAHLLNVCQTPQACASVLHSRLVHLPELQSICQSLEHRLQQPYLTAWHALPDLPINALKRTLTSPTNLVNACAISPDGSWFLSASDDSEPWISPGDSTLRIWDAANGQLRHTLSGHTQSVEACAISPDGSFILSASKDHTLRVWNTVSGQIRHTLIGHTSRVSACAISPDSSWLLSASLDGTLRIWDAASGQIRHTLSGHTDSVEACAISPDGSFILSASDDGTLRIWDTVSGQLYYTLIGHTSGVSACSISPDGSWLLSASLDGTLRIWDAASGQIRHILIGHTDSVNACAINLDGSFILSASTDHTLCIWDATSGRLRHTLTGHTDSVDTCAISPDGSWLLSASTDHTLRIWDATTGQVRHTLSGHTDRVFACSISPDGSWLLSASKDHTLRIWDTSSDQRRHTYSGHTDRVFACSISPDSSWLLSASKDYTLRIWDIANGQICHTLTGHTDRVFACAISPDGSYILSASKDHTLRTWDAINGQMRHILTGHTKGAKACAISSDGSFILSASFDGTLRIWDATSGQCLRTLTGHTKGVFSCAISPDDSWLLSASKDHTLRVWDAASGQCLHTLTGHTHWVRVCAISPDGNFILSASDDDTLRIWNTASGKLHHTLTGHTDRVSSCAISPDGSFILSASDDHTLRIWDTASGKLRHVLTGHTDRVRACSISSDGIWLLSASDDGTLRIWDTATKICRATLQVNGALGSCSFGGDRYQIIAGGECGVYFLRAVDRGQ